MTYSLTIITLNFCCQTWVSDCYCLWNRLVSIDRSIDLLGLPSPPLSNLPLLPLPLPCLSLLSHLVYPKPSCFSFLENFEKSACAPMSYWILLTLFFYRLVVFQWDLELSKNSYFMIPLSRPLHNGISFVASVRSFIPHMFLLSSPHIVSSDCIWPTL
jgi:hypothetical protein